MYRYYCGSPSISVPLWTIYTFDGEDVRKFWGAGGTRRFTLDVLVPGKLQVLFIRDFYGATPAETQIKDLRTGEIVFDWKVERSPRGTPKVPSPVFDGRLPVGRYSVVLKGGAVSWKMTL